MIVQGGRPWRPGRKGLMVAFALLAAAVLIGSASLDSGSPAAGSGSGPQRSGSSPAARAPGHLRDVGDSAARSPGPYRPGVVLVGFRRGTPPAGQNAVERGVGASAVVRLGPAIRPVGDARGARRGALTPLLLKLSGADVAGAVRALRREPAVAYAEPTT